MRKNIKRLCVTTWGAVLEIKGIWEDEEIVWITDPWAVDAGAYISKSDIILIATVKKLKNEQDYNDNFMLTDGNSVWGKD